EPTKPGLLYEVYRALDATILARAGQTMADDTTLLQLADQHVEAFARLQTSNAAGEPLTGTGGPIVFTDSLPGTGDNRFVYKTCAVDRAGNRSPLSGGLVVYLIDIVSPTPPNITAIRAGDRQLTLRWVRGREPDLALYRLYRTTEATAAADVRLRPLVASFIFDASAATPADRAVEATSSLGDDSPGQLTYTDPGLPGGSDHFYRLVAVDRAGNASPASQAVMARAYDASRPTPPTWQPPSAVADGLVLSWTADDPNLTCLVQRCTRGEAWRRLSTWLGRGVYAYTDTSRAAGIVYRYRLLVLDGAGRSNSDFDVLQY